MEPPTGFDASSLTPNVVQSDEALCNRHHGESTVELGNEGNCGLDACRSAELAHSNPQPFPIFVENSNDLFATFFRASSSSRSLRLVSQRHHPPAVQGVDGLGNAVRASILQ